MLTRSITKLCYIHSRNQAATRRNASILSSLRSSPVLISSNKDIYTNLALEHWLYTNLRFTQLGEHSTDPRTFQRPIVFMYMNEPCVVIGRHQNPWIEANLGFIDRTGIKLARRHSGGGCVYHDENNINISVIGGRDDFENRQANLSFLAKVINDSYGIKCEPTKRHDLVHSDTGLKLTGSAAKLGKHNSYHHFTLLVDTDKEILHEAIRREPQDFIKTHSTASTRASVINLKELKDDLNVDQVLSDLADAYVKRYKDPHEKVPARKEGARGDVGDTMELEMNKEVLRGWKWIYGMTPRFKLERLIKFNPGDDSNVRLTVSVSKGLFESVEIEGKVPGGISIANLIERFQSLKGTKFTYRDSMVNVSKLLDDGDGEGPAELGFEALFIAHLLQLVQQSHL